MSASTTTSVSFAAPTNKMPKVIAEAILAVQGKITSLAPSAFNEHDKYKFVSVDQIFEAIRVLLNEVKLVVIPVEISPTELVMVETKNGLTQMCRVHVGFIYILGDEQYFNPLMSETLFVRLGGAQTFQSAKSYAQKAHFRQLFKIPTGEPDLDSEPSGSADPKKAPVKSKARAPETPESIAESATKKAEILKALVAVKRPLRGAEADDFIAKYGAVIDTLTVPDRNVVREAYKVAAKTVVS